MSRCPSTRTPLRTLVSESRKSNRLVCYLQGVFCKVCYPSTVKGVLSEKVHPKVARLRCPWSQSTSRCPSTRTPLRTLVSESRNLNCLVCYLQGVFCKIGYSSIVIGVLSEKNHPKVAWLRCPWSQSMSRCPSTRTPLRTLVSKPCDLNQL